MTAVEVSYKASGVCISSKITDSYVASFPGLFPTSSLSVYTHGTFETNNASLGHLLKSGKGFSRVHRVHRFSATNSGASNSLVFQAFIISSMSPWVRVCESSPLDLHATTVYNLWDVPAAVLSHLWLVVFAVTTLWSTTVGLQQSDEGLSENPDRTELKQYYCQTTGSQSGSNVRKLENPGWTHTKQATDVHA